jgi:hypothetical protein
MNVLSTDGPNDTDGVSSDRPTEGSGRDAGGAEHNDRPTRRAVLGMVCTGAAAVAGCGASGNGNTGNGNSGNGNTGNGNGGSGGSDDDNSGNGNGTSSSGGTGGSGTTASGGGGTVTGQSLSGSVDNSQPAKLEVLSHSGTAGEDVVVVRMEAKNVSGETRTLAGYGVWAELYVEERENPIIRRKFRKSGVFMDGSQFEVSARISATDLDRASDFGVADVDSYRITI